MFRINRTKEEYEAERLAFEGKRELNNGEREVDRAYNALAEPKAPYQYRLPYRDEWRS